MMKFCPECGTKTEGMKFCGNCGHSLGESSATIKENSVTRSEDPAERTIMEFSTYMFGLEGKADSLVKIPQEQYILTNERLKIIKQGMISKTHDEIELFKIKDIIVKQKMKDKVMKVGDIEIISADESTPKLNLKRIKDPHDVKESIRSSSMQAKKEIGVSYRHDI